MNRQADPRSAEVWPVIVIVCFLALFALRAWMVESHFGEAVACSGCFFWPSIAEDCWILALVALLLAGVFLLPWRWASRLAGGGVSVVFLLYLTDLYVFKTFGTRLFLSDLALYGLNFSLILEQLGSWGGGRAGTMVIVVILFGVSAAPMMLRRTISRSIGGGLVLIAVAAVAVASFASVPDYVHNWGYQNFVQANSRTSESARYSRSEVERLTRRYQESFPDRCVEHVVDDRNVIVLIVESWSSFQSSEFGGHLNWTPELDRVARENVRYNRVHAGGFSTNEGLVNLLGGVRLWAPFQHLFDAAEFGHAWGIENSLPEVFNEAGFHTAFLTPGPLDFLRKGEWLADLGFDYIEGNQHPFYREWPRVAFHAAADEALYERTLEWLEQEAPEPHLLVLETITTHQPYVDPESRELDMEKAFRYADRHAAEFLEELESVGYFDDGVVVITSDHRSMTPISRAEHERFGLAAASRVPLVVVDKRWEGEREVDRVHGLGDLAPSLAHRVHGEVCLDAVQSSLFESADRKAGCALHLRGAQRGVVDVFCGSGQGQVRLEGDDTRFIWSEGLSADTRDHVLEVIARERIEGMQRARRHSASP